MEIVAEPFGQTRFFFPHTIYGPRASRLGHKSKGKKLGPQLTVRTKKTKLARGIMKRTKYICL